MNALTSASTPAHSPVRQQGLTLIELMVAMAIGLLVMGTMVKVYVDSSRLYNFNDEFSQMQANGRFALEVLRRDARLAGFWGCNQDIDMVNQIKASHYNRRSYTNVADANPHSTGKGVAIGGTDDNTLTAWPQQITTLNVSDTITFRGATGQTFDLSADIPAANLSADVILTSANHGIDPGETALISNCQNGDIFEVTGTTGAALEHKATQNDSAALSKEYKESESAVYLVNEIEYCIGTGTDGVTPTLRRLSYPNQAAGLTCANDGVDLIEGAENMQILFGLDLDAAEDGVADVYLEADHTAMDMDKVVSIRISLLLRSVSNGVTDEPQPFTYMGTTTTPPATDRFLRRVFNATITLRNGALVSAS